MQGEENGRVEQPVGKPYDDEISLVDIWLVLARRKRLIGFVFSGVLLLGLGYYLVTPSEFEYKTVLETGWIWQPTEVGEQLMPLDTAAVIKGRLESFVIPRVAQRMTADSADSPRPRFQLKPLEDEKTLVMTSTGPAEDREFHIQMHGQVVESLTEAYLPRIEAVQLEIERAIQKAGTKLEALQSDTNVEKQILDLERRLNNAQLKLQRLQSESLQRPAELEARKRIDGATQRILSLQDEKTLVQHRIQGVEKNSELVEHELAEVKGYIETARKDREASVRQVERATEAMSQLLIDSQIQQLMERQAMLEQRLLVTLPAETHQLQSRQRELDREIEQAKLDKAKAESELSRLREDRKLQIDAQNDSIQFLQRELSRAKFQHDHAIALQTQKLQGLEDRFAQVSNIQGLYGPQQSLRPVGASLPLMTSLSGMIGIMLGVFGALLAGLRDTVRQAQSRSQVYPRFVDEITPQFDCQTDAEDDQGQISSRATA